MARRRKIVEEGTELSEETKTEETTVDDIEEPTETIVTTEAPVEDTRVEEASYKITKSTLNKLMEDAPHLSVVMQNPWTYSEWLAKLNTLILNS